jgi:hypothetical protein
MVRSDSKNSDYICVGVDRSLWFDAKTTQKPH